MFSVRILILSTLAPAACGMLAFAACGDDDKPSGDAADIAGDTLPEGRTYLLAARAEAYDAAASRTWTASLASLTLPPEEGAAAPERPVEAIILPLDTIGIPWSAFSGTDNRPTELPAAWLAEVSRMQALATQAGKEVILALSPLSPEYDTLAPDARDESGALVLNSAWRPYCYDPSTDGNPTKYRDQFAGYARWVTERFSPHAVIVAQRLNLYEATCGTTAYGALVDYAGEAARRIAASDALTVKPPTVASLDVEDLYGFPKKDDRCQSGTPADCLAGRKALITRLEASGVSAIGLESYPANAFPDAVDVPSDWLARVLASVTKPSAIAGAELPAVAMETPRGVCTPLLESSEAAQRAFLDQVLAAAAAKDMIFAAWRHLLDLQPAAVVTACPCAGDAALCNHLDGLGSKRDERRLALVGGLADAAATERQALTLWKSVLAP